MTLIDTDDFPNEARTANSTYKKLAVQWLNEHSAPYQVLWWQKV